MSALAGGARWLLPGVGLSVLLLLSGCTAMLMGGQGSGGGAAASDAVIAQRVSSALAADPAVDAAGIAVEVSRQVVVLRGTVPDARQRLRAAEVAGRVADVATVRNQLRVPVD
jgi:osmotically-inducible protein OsmY